MATSLPRYYVKQSVRPGRPRNHWFPKLLIPLLVVSYLLYARSAAGVSIRSQNNQQSQVNQELLFRQKSEFQKEANFDIHKTPSIVDESEDGASDEFWGSEGDEGDGFLQAPRRPSSWSPPLQRLIETGAAQEAKTKERQLEGKTQPSWVTSPSWTRAFPDYKEYAKLVQKAGTLPDLVMIPLDSAVANDTLQGWEHQWISEGIYDVERWGKLEEPKIDFVYTWVNGSEESFRKSKRPYELNSTLNDPEGTWVARHGTHRYRDWNEFRFSLRSLEAHAPFKNKIQVLVNAVMQDELGVPSKQEPSWLSKSPEAQEIIEILSQEEFFESDKRGCLPTFNSLTIENQLHNTASDVDRIFALSDDMLLGKPHSASDIYSPLFGPMMGFKTNSYNTKNRPTEADAKRFGEKPWLIYTSWLLNRRFGFRKRKGMAHFGHSLSRKVMGEAMRSFPGPELQSACSRFRGDFGFQLYSWYAAFHYTIERHREALLWSYLMVRADADQNENFSWQERQTIMNDIKEGRKNEGESSFRTRNFYTLPEILEAAGLEPPSVNFDILWTSLDGPVMTKDIDCFNFDINECLAPGFTMEPVVESERNPTFSTAAVFDRVARQQPECGDCLLKILLHRVRKGLSPLLPDKDTQSAQYDTVVKALMRYQYTVMDPDGLFVMVTDAEQVESQLIKRFGKREKHVGQLCLNDDVSTEDQGALEDLQGALNDMYTGLFPKPSIFEADA